MTDNEILDLAASAGITAVCCKNGGTYRDGVDTLKLFAEKVIEKFLKNSGQYVTNDASREAAIAQAVSAEHGSLIAQRDELRAALEFLVDTTLPQTRQQEQCWISIQQALGKTKGQN